ncbi:hypothetical protein [Neisseria sp. Ec49-e6-T10]|uniref:hypothetical protein n=1 Tax=Neisseria sp. Ec49-e6-T10 TaxID=3140744 RepID=UPI003EBBC176
MNITEEQVVQIKTLFDGVANAQEERASIQKAVLQLYLIAGDQTPIFADKAGNFKDGTADGRMDCVDHSETDTYFLKFLSRLNLLQFHEIMKPYYRAPRILDLHYASRIKEKENGQQWVVDTWFYDFGHEPVVLEADKWRKGWYPEGW